MKPRLNRTIYCIYENCIFKTKVMFLGEYSFIQEEFGNAYEEESWEYNYDDYGRTWFTSFEKAKAKMLEDKPNKKLVKTGINFWEVQDND